MDRFARLSYFKNKVIILAYHGFTDKKVHPGIENYQGKHLDVNLFRSQVEYLKRCYNVIPLDRLIEYFTMDAEIPNNSVVITIDDGYKSNYTLAYPVLKEFNVPATIFIAAAFVDNKELLWVDRVEYAINKTERKDLKIDIGPETLLFSLKGNNTKALCESRIRSRLKLLPQDVRDEIVNRIEEDLGQRLSLGRKIAEIYRPLEWNEVSEMIKSGIISIGSHGCAHVSLTRCSNDNMEREASLSKKIIEERIGSRIKPFSYPNGGIGDFNNKTKRLLKETGYLCALTNTTGVNSIHSDIFELKRFGMSKRGDLGEFKRILAGIARFPGYIRQSILSMAQSQGAF